MKFARQNPKNRPNCGVWLYNLAAYVAATFRRPGKLTFLGCLRNGPARCCRPHSPALPGLHTFKPPRLGLPADRVDLFVSFPLS